MKNKTAQTAYFAIYDESRSVNLPKRYRTFEGAMRANQKLNVNLVWRRYSIVRVELPTG